MKYKYEYMSQTQLGQLFGVTRNKIGKWLKELGLRTLAGSPSSEAFSSGMVKQNYYADDETYNYVWHTENTVIALEHAGHERTINPPKELIAAPTFQGSFSLRESANDSWQIVGSNNEVAIVVIGRENALVIERLMNLSSRCGFLSKLQSEIKRLSPKVLEV